MTIHYRNATEADAEALAELFASVFDETFGPLYQAADEDAFLAQHSPVHWAGQLRDPQFAVRMGESGVELAGYAKLGPSRLPVKSAGPASELRQLYVCKAWHGTGVAAALMDWTIAEALRRGSRELYLTVFVDNHRARRFYDRYGFEDVGSYQFMVGSQADEDIIMKLAL